MSLFYDCNECKEKEYVKENVIRAANQLEQQSIVDQQIAESLGLDVQASTLSRLAKRVINSIGSDLLPTDINIVETAKQKLPTDYLLQAITTGKLSQLFDRIKTVDPKKLSKKAKLIQSDLKSDQMVKDVLNEEIANILDDITITPEEKPVAIKKAIIDIAAGGDEKVVEELTGYASDDSISSQATTAVSTWANVYNDIPELAGAQATIDTLIRRGKNKTIKLYSTEKKTNGDYKLLAYGANKYLEMKLDSDGPQFLYEKRGGKGGSKKNAVDYEKLKTSGVLPNLNTQQLIRDLTA